MKFSLVILSTLACLTLTDPTDVIGYANMKAREILSNKINSGVYAKLGLSFENQNTDAKKDTQPTPPVAVQPTVFPIVQNTQPNPISQGQNTQLIKVSPPAFSTVTQTSFVQQTPLPTLPPQEPILAASPAVTQTILPTQVTPLPATIQSQSQPQVQVVEAPVQQLVVDMNPPLVMAPPDPVYQPQVCTTISTDSNEDDKQEDEQQDEDQVIATPLIKSNDQPQPIVVPAVLVPPASPAQPTPTIIQTKTPTPTSNPIGPVVPALFSTPVVPSSPQQNLIFLTPQLNLMRGVTNTINGKQNILDGQNNKIDGNLNIAQGHDNEIYGLGNDIVANNAVVKGHKNTIIEDIGGLELF